jgi:hypothetical protein
MQAASRNILPVPLASSVDLINTVRDRFDWLDLRVLYDYKQ